MVNLPLLKLLELAQACDNVTCLPLPYIHTLRQTRTCVSVRDRSSFSHNMLNLVTVGSFEWRLSYVMCRRHVSEQRYSNGSWYVSILPVIQVQTQWSLAKLSPWQQSHTTLYHTFLKADQGLNADIKPKLQWYSELSPESPITDFWLMNCTHTVVYLP